MDPLHAHVGGSFPRGRRESYARTDETVQIPHPDESKLPHSPTIEGMRYKRTLTQFSLEKKVTIVTGGARGLGLVMSQAIITSGSDLAIVDLNKEEAEYQAEHLGKQFMHENPTLESPPRITAHYADVSSPDSANQAIDDIIALHGHIDNLVTSAGFTENFDAIHYPPERIQKCWAVNVDGSYHFATGLARHLIERKSPGSIVMIGSMSGAVVNVPQPQAPYNAAKAAIRQLASSFAVEWAPYDIRVNCVSPGYMMTALYVLLHLPFQVHPEVSVNVSRTRKILDDNPELEEKWTSLIPTGKMGDPEDLMGPVTFLLSEAAKYVTGADLRVDGGYTLT